MTIQHDSSGPSTEAYRSTRFVATVNGTEQYVYGYTRSAGFTTTVWEYLDDVEVSWLKFGADQSVTVTIELADATPITSATVYPKNVQTDQSIADGVLTLTVPTNERLYVEVNGERDQPLCIFAEPLKSSLPGAYDAFYADLGKPIQSVDAGTDKLTFASPHGLSNGDEIILNIRPTGGSFPPPLAAGVVYSVIVSDSTSVTLADENGDSVDITNDATAVLYANVREHTDTVNALYFPAGRWVIGKNFPLATNTTVYLDRGAVVVGGFNLRDVSGVSIKGPGQISGELHTFEEVYALAYQDKLQYCTFNGQYDADNYSDNTVQGVTVFATPFWMSVNGVWSYRNVQFVSPWTSNTDGFLPTRRNSATYASEVVDCFSFCGDDAIHIENRGPIVRTVSGCFIVNTAASCLHAGYEPEGTSNIAYGNTISDCDLMHLQQSSGDGAVIRAWMDGWAEAASKGVFNCSMSDIRVWGPLQRPFLSLRNYSAPWDSDVRLLYGQIAEWSFDGVSIEQEPLSLSVIEGKDATSTPHDITFTDFAIEDVLVTEDNYTDYFTLNEFPYSITWDEAPETPSDPTIVVEDGTGKADAESYMTVAEADARAVARGNPTEWTSATTAQKQHWLRQAASAGIDIMFGSRWSGYRTTDTQALDWPRVGAGDNRTGRMIDDDVVPAAVKSCQFEFALSLARGIDPLENLDPSDPADRSRWATSTTDRIAGGFEETRGYGEGAPRFAVLPRMVAFASPYFLDDDVVGIA